MNRNQETRSAYTDNRRNRLFQNRYIFIKGTSNQEDVTTIIINGYFEDQFVIISSLKVTQ